MNLKRLALEMNDLARTGSWPQLTSGFWRCPLSMNHRSTEGLAKARSVWSARGLPPLSRAQKAGASSSSLPKKSSAEHLSKIVLLLSSDRVCV